MSDKKPPTRPKPEEERDIEYLVCRECETPCYTFQMEGGHLLEAFCSMCGNDDVLLFSLREEEEDE